MTLIQLALMQVMPAMATFNNLLMQRCHYANVLAAEARAYGAVALLTFVVGVNPWLYRFCNGVSRQVAVVDDVAMTLADASILSSPAGRDVLLENPDKLSWSYVAEVQTTIARLRQEEHVYAEAAALLETTLPLAGRCSIPLSVLAADDFDCPALPRLLISTATSTPSFVLFVLFQSW